MSLSLFQRKLSPSLQGLDLNGPFSFTKLFSYMLGTRDAAHDKRHVSLVYPEKVQIGEEFVSSIVMRSR
jgi:hypothetical protein